MARIQINTTVRDILTIVLALALLNSLPIPFLDFSIFGLFGVAFTVKLILNLSLVTWLLMLMPSPLREIGCIFFVLWIFSTFNFFGGWNWIVMLVLVMFLFLWILGLFG